MTRSVKVANEAKIRDDYQCQKCDYRSTDRVHAHHIIPLAVGGNDSTENIATLCNKCHSFAPDNLELEHEEY